MAMAPSTPTLVPFERHLQGLADATDRLGHAVHMSWLGAEVPTCPGWTVLELVAHQGMVHRWGRAALLGDEATMAASARIETEGRCQADPVGWLHHGSWELRQTLESLPDDHEALTFLREAPPARAFWARRQCHETTIHALDGVAAELGRMPTALDAWFGADLALDGIDELLVGFWQRPRYAPRSPSDERVLIAPHEVDHGWLVRTDTDGCRVRRFALKRGDARDLVVDDNDPEGETERTEAHYEVDAVVSGPAIDLYLALWNRGGSVEDPHGMLARWRDQSAIRW